MPFFLRSAISDLKRRGRDPLSLITWAGIPLFLAFILNLLFGGGRGTGPHARLLVADEDKSIVSQSFVTGLKRNPMIEIEDVKRDLGRARVAHGEASALMVLPAGLGAAFFQNKGARIQLITNPAQRILPGIIEETVAIGTEVAYQRRSALMAQVRSRTIPNYTNPPVIDLHTTVIEQKSTVATNFGAAYFPGILFMSILFIAQGLAADIWEERTQGVIRRMAAMPRQFSGFLAGRIVSVSVLFAVVGSVGLLCARWFLKMQVEQMAVAALWIVVTGGVLFLVLLVFQLHTPTERAGNTYTNITMLVLAMLGGSFFPFEMMPPALAHIGRFTPNGWGVTQFAALLTGASDARVVAISFAAFASVGAVLFVFAKRQLLRSFAQ